MRFFLPDHALLYTVYPDGGYINKRLHTFGLEPQVLKELGFERMKAGGLKEDLIETWAVKRDWERLSIATYPGSPFLAFQSVAHTGGEKDGMTQFLVWDSSSIRRPRPTQEQWPNYRGTSREPRY